MRKILLVFLLFSGLCHAQKLFPQKHQKVGSINCQSQGGTNWSTPVFTGDRVSTDKNKCSILYGENTKIDLVENTVIDVQHSRIWLEKGTIIFETTSDKILFTTFLGSIRSIGIGKVKALIVFHGKKMDVSVSEGSLLLRSTFGHKDTLKAGHTYSLGQSF